MKGLVISGMAGMICFNSGTYSTLICRHLHSEFGPVRSRDHGITNGCKIVLSANILTLCAQAPFFRHTTMCLVLLQSVV